MTQQRLSFLWFPLTVALAACGGGSGRMVDHSDPAAAPKIADQQPPIVNGNPASATSSPPGARQPLPPDPNAPPTSAPPTGGGGDCVRLCNGLNPSCETPEGCVEDCNQHVQESDCGAEGISLATCANAVACVDDLDDLENSFFNAAVLIACPLELQALLACMEASEPND